jgi:hypothetical protein
MCGGAFLIEFPSLLVHVKSVIVYIYLDRALSFGLFFFFFLSEPLSLPIEMFCGHPDQLKNKNQEQAELLSVAIRLNIGHPDIVKGRPNNS